MFKRVDFDFHCTTCVFDEHLGDATVQSCWIILMLKHTQALARSLHIQISCETSNILKRYENIFFLYQFIHNTCPRRCFKVLIYWFIYWSQFLEHRLRCFPFLTREVHSLTPFIRFPVEAHVKLKKEISSLYLWLSFTSVYLNAHTCAAAAEDKLLFAACQNKLWMKTDKPNSPRGGLTFSLSSQLSLSPLVWKLGRFLFFSESVTVNLM